MGIMYISVVTLMKLLKLIIARTCNSLSNITTHNNISNIYYLANHSKINLIPIDFKED